MPKRLLIEMTASQFDNIKKASVELREIVKAGHLPLPEERELTTVYKSLEVFLRQNKLTRDNFVEA